MFSPGSVLDGRYEVIGQLAAGGMGEVYRARRVLLGDEVAIKVIRTTGDDRSGLRERFLHESRTCAQLRHPNIVTILDFGIAADGQPYLVMEYLNGPSLREELATEGRMSPARVQAVVDPLCAALQLAHDRGIVHRDLKPANIVSHRFESGEVVHKLIDFGLANIREAAEPQVPHLAQFMGTVVYASPEQLQAQDLDGRTDIYSLGAVVFEMLTGHPPYEAATPLGVITKHLCDPVPAAREHIADLPPWLDQVVGKALAKEPDERWQSMAELARALSGPGGGEMGTSPGLSGLHGKYEVGPIINAGRLGSRVHRGTHRALGQAVAIRLLERREGQDWGAVRARFLKEARALQVAHSSVIQVRDFGEEQDVLYVVTDFIEGLSLLQALDAEAPFAWSRVHRLGTQLVEAAQAVHKRQGLVCGVNPETIRMTSDVDGECLLISTGGIGQLEELTASLGDEAAPGEEPSGSELPYIAPEVLAGNPADTRSDVFTLGTLLYEMATGIVPFGGRTLSELLAAMTGGAPRDPREFRPEVPASGAACILQCLRQDPAARFQTLGALRKAWERCAGAEAGAPG